MDFEFFPVTSNNSVRKRVNIEVSIELIDNLIISDEYKKRFIKTFRRIPYC